MILSITLLLLPTVWHLWNDKDGEEPSEKATDILIVFATAMSAAVIGGWIADKALLASLFLAWAIHFLVFDYAIVYILKRRGVIETRESWYTYLGKSYTDDVLRQWSPHVRLKIKLVIFIAALIVYFL